MLVPADDVPRTFSTVEVYRRELPLGAATVVAESYNRHVLRTGYSGTWACVVLSLRRFRTALRAVRLEASPIVMQAEGAEV